MSQQRRFGFDIDGTVTDPGSFIPYLNKHFNKSLTINDITEYDLTTVLEVSHKDFWNWMKEHEENIYAEAIIAPYFPDVLSKWQNQHELFYVSARGNYLESVTKDWFLRHEIPYHHIELIGSHNKINTINKLEIDIFFEDKHDNACDIAEECNIPVILLDTPYNRLPTPKNVIRSTNWQEAFKWVDQWEKQIAK